MPKQGGVGWKVRCPCTTTTPSHAHTLTHPYAHANAYMILTPIFTHALTLTYTCSHSLTHIYSNWHSLTHSLTYPLTHSLTLTHSFTHSLTHPLTHSLTLTHPSQGLGDPSSWIDMASSARGQCASGARIVLPLFVVCECVFGLMVLSWVCVRMCLCVDGQTRVRECQLYSLFCAPLLH